MTPKDMERQLFCEGCSIEAEVSREDRSMIRLISTPRGEQYKLLYHRNEHNDEYLKECLDNLAGKGIVLEVTL